ncbi:uncharacterized protein C8A04DRAFT_14797 [Dichotomopilus funicola]|uniref:DUF3824 domain-containing protein n=1 Tax=Dichotomopilus funicola TaxID=1934379 RepID=A0AAN6UX24_9PEZI|nr:hypothetical protein C8A04DRAFT_14797 [Dichotomopilus funicola]
MPEVYREARYVRERSRDRDTSPSDDEGYKRTTVRRYKVGGDRVERVDREIDVVEEERRSRYAPVRRSSRDEVVEVDRRVDRLYIPERPRSNYEPSPHSATYVERQVVEREREREPREDHYTRVERIVERDDDHRRGDDRSRVVYESTKEIDRVDRDRERDRDRDLYSPREWERRSHWDDEKDTEVRIEKRVEHRDSHGADLRIERRVEERRDDPYSPGGDNVERWRKETEYYAPAQPAPAPIVIRQRAPEQRIIVQEAAPATVVIREQADKRDLALARQGSREGEVYYHRESREVGPYRGERREEEYAIARYDDEHRRHHHHHHHHRRHHHHHGHSEGESDGEYYVRRTITQRERSASSSPHRKRHIAEGALAGAGLSAILASRRDSHGEYKQNRGRKVLAGAAIGAIGTEVARRAHSAYQDRYGDEDNRDRSRSRSRSRPPHSRLKTGLGIAAVALAAAGAAKYYQSNKIEKEEMHRGRALHRDSDTERSLSRKRSKSRASSVAKAGLGTAAAVGLVQHYRNKSKSKSRDGKSRSRSRLRTGAEIVAAGLAGAGAKKLYDRRKDKKEEEKERDREREREFSDDEYYNSDGHDRHGRSRSRSLTRSGPTYPDGDSSTADPELGMVEYGAHPLYADPPQRNERGAAAAEGYESAAEERSRRRRRRKSRRSRDDDDDYSADSEADTDRDKKAEKKRSGSRLRDLAAGYGDERPPDGYDTYTRREPSPPHASGGYYNGPPPTAAQQPPVVNGFTQHPNVATTNLHQHYAPYPPDGPYAPYAPPVPGPPPNTAVPDLASPPPGPVPVPVPPPTPGPGPVPPPGPVQAHPDVPPSLIPGVHPPPPHPTGPEHVSEASRVGRSTPEPKAAVRSVDGDKKGASTGEMEPPDTPRTAKSVVFIPLSPKSSATLRRHHEEQTSKSETEDATSASESDYNRDPRGKKRAAASHDDEDTVEVLPDRFDSQGRPLDGSARSSSASGWHSRRGDFEYRSPRGPGGMNMRGEWGVAAPDAAAVERIVRDVTGVLEGRGSWIGLIGGILSGSLLQGGEEGGHGSEREGSRDRDRDRDRDRERDRDRDRSKDRERDGDRSSRQDRDEERRRRRRDDHDDENEYRRDRKEEDDDRRNRRKRDYDDDEERDRDRERERERDRERERKRRDDEDRAAEEKKKSEGRRGRYERKVGVGRSQTWG